MVVSPMKIKTETIVLNKEAYVQKSGPKPVCFKAV